MKWKMVDNEIEIMDLSIRDRTKLFQLLHKEKPLIECMCKPYNKEHPTLHIRKSKTDKYFPVNNQGNKKYNREHAEDCIYNTELQRYLREKGIKILEDGTIECSIKRTSNNTSKPLSKDPSSTIKREININNQNQTRPRVALRFLFYYLFQKYDANVYKPKEQRNIHSRLYSSICETILDKTNLKGSGLVVSNSSYYNYKIHTLIIGWGRKDQPVRKENFYEIDMHCLDEHNKIKYQHKIPYWIYDKASLTRVGVNTGYWIIYRRMNNNRLSEEQVIFVPAEEETMIPVDSSHEVKMIKHLKSKGYQFKRPLVMSDDKILPDFILNKNEDTIIEVAGMLGDDDYEKRLKEKEKYYTSKQLKYIQWDTVSPINI